MIELTKNADRAAHYRLMAEAVRAMTEGEDDLVCALANISAVLNAYLDDINWVGFYLEKGGRLVLGPFQGLPACTRIDWGKGVCGTAAMEARTIVVPDVHAFPGHIACDAASRSEIVLPLFRGDEVFGVLDVDSPLPDRFGPEEEAALVAIAKIISDFINSLSL